MPSTRTIKWLISTLFLFHFSGVWTGFSCLSNPCVHGVCLDDLNSTYFCYCIDGYTGVQCQTNWNECWSDPCQNGGTCIDGIAKFNCSCPSGFVGELCEQDLNECESNPCQNNSTCEDGPNGYICHCLPGYEGIHCEIDVAVCNVTNETRCYNGGICEEGPGDSFFCRCQPGWDGHLCESEINECVSAPCQNGAICIDLHANYACACLFGFAGRNCEQIVQLCNKNPCKNGALCLVEENQPTCYCVPDFHGELCQYQYDECQLGPRCVNGGTCIDGIDTFTCSCPANLTGLFCECLILESNELDCSYVAPTTTTEVTTLSTTNLTTNTTGMTIPFTFVDTTLPTTTTTGYMENITYFPPADLTTTTATSTETTVSMLYVNISTMTDFTGTSSGTKEPMTTETATTTVLDVKNGTTTESSLVTLPINITDFTITEITTVTIPQTFTNFTTDNMTITTTTINVSTEEKPTEVTTTTEFSYSITSTQTFLTEEPREITDFTTVTSTTTSVTDSILDTTLSTSTTSSPDLIDCTLSSSKCQNGGSCIYAEKGYKCLCPFDAEGTFCEITLGIRNAAFDGESYLSHRLFNRTHIDLEFEAKTLLSNGLLFYSNIGSSYMSVYIEEGYLKFKFSCGYQTMLLSELNVPVNNGYLMNVKANLDFNQDLKHCFATIKVNDTLTMTGDQMANVMEFFKPPSWLHLGTIPEGFSIDHIKLTGGFVGCMSNLKIFGNRINIFKDAEDGFGVKECSSLVCLSNPCRNNGVCSTRGDDWLCHCKNGYLGKRCEQSICDNNPCYFGGTCLPFSGNGYICLCPYGKHGHFCENDLKIMEPHFSPSIKGLSSYVAYPIPVGVFHNMEIKFRFTPVTLEQISILLFIGQNNQHDFHSDHLAVSFVKGYIMLTWNLGAGPRRIFMSQPIKKGARDYLVKLGLTGRKAWLYVENTGNITGRAPGSLTNLDVLPLIYVGGHESQYFKKLPHDLPLHSGFSGCIFDLELKSGNIILPLHGHLNVFGRAVGQCGTTECFDQSCQNGGACLHHASTFMCLCQDNWFDPLCSSRNNLCEYNYTKCSDSSICVPFISNYKCDCPFGKIGKYCDKSENITDISLTGERSFILLNFFDFHDTRVSFSIELRFLKDDGLIFFIGDKENGFLSLNLQNNVIELRVCTNKNKPNEDSLLSIRSSKLLLKGIWYNVEFGVFGRKVYLSVNDVINTGLTNGNVLKFSNKEIYLGGLPDMSYLPTLATSSYPIPFTGCFRHFYLDSNHIPLTFETIKQGRNIVDCDGTPCGGESCLHGGTCWLDSFMKPRCSCVQPFFGDKCQLVPECDEKTCKNGGVCYHGKCLCNVGFTGVYCENEIKIEMPKFSGMSYLKFKKVDDKKRDLVKMEVSKLYINFTTAKPDGLILWDSKDDEFTGIGIENGYLKVTYSHGGKHYVDIVSTKYISDGLFHSVEILFGAHKILLDSVIVEIMNDNITDENHHVFLNDVIYIGGLPSNDTLKETFGMFHENFEGCIEGFAINNERKMKDFSHLEGRNIDVCNIV